jgi:DNA polymerase III subunit epsilon
MNDAAFRLDTPLAFFDVETTGLSSTYHRIIEIAVVRYEPGEKTPTRFFTLINPERHIPSEITRITGIKNGDVTSAPTFRQIAPEINRFIKDADLCGYNASRFDCPFLEKEFERTGVVVASPKDRVVVDPMNILRKQEKKNATLEAAYLFYTGEKLSEKHRALADTEATVSVLRSQIKRYKLVGTPKNLRVYNENQLNLFD